MKILAKKLAALILVEKNVYMITYYIQNCLFPKL